MLEQMKAYIGDNVWVTEVFGVVLLTLVLRWVWSFVHTRIGKGLTNTTNRWDDLLWNATDKPASTLILLIGLACAAKIVALRTDSVFVNTIEVTRSIGIILCVAWFCVRFIHGAEKQLVTQSKLDQSTVNALGRLIRISVIITAVLVIMQSMGYSISGVLAFGGVGGLAVGLAAKDLLANFFGGLMIYLDRPFKVGDWVRSPDRNIEGVVEAIGWRLTCIRTFDKRPLYVPNSTFTSIAVENPSRMLNRRINETIGLRYCDAAKMKVIVEEVTAYLSDHQDIDTDQTLMVNFNAFAASSLDFFIYCFTKTTVWAEYHQVKQNVLLGIIDIIHKHGADVAFPTRTVHLEQATA